jgi:cellulose biosynthesis protein BcsQ
MDGAISPRSRAALLTVDLVLVPVRLPPFVRAAFAETLRFVNEANTFRPRLRTRIVLNRRTRTTSMPMRLHKRSPSVIRRC